MPEGTPTIYRAGRRAFMPDTIDTIVPKGTPTIYRAGRRAFMPDTIHDESCLKALLPALLPKLNPRVGFCLCRNPMRAEALIYPLLPTAYLIPFSVMIAVIYFAGVISKAGFRTSTSKGAMHLPIILVTS